MALHSSTLAWKIPWTEEPGGLQSMRSLSVGHDWVTSLSLSYIGEGNSNPFQYSCLENPRDRGAWWTAVYGVAQSRTQLKWLSSSSSSSSSSYIAGGFFTCWTTWEHMHALITWLSCTDHVTAHALMTWLFGHWSRVYQAVISDWHQASLSITNLWSSPKLMCIESVMPSSHLILCCPILLLPLITLSIMVFSNESTLCMRWPKCWRYSLSISPSNEHPGLVSFRMDWLNLLAI